MREYAKILREMIDQGHGDADIQKTINFQMETIFRIVGICLGVPNESFIFEYYDKNKKYHTTGIKTPLEFYEEFVKPCYNVDDKVKFKKEQYL